MWKEIGKVARNILVEVLLAVALAVIATVLDLPIRAMYVPAGLLGVALGLTLAAHDRKDGT